MENNNDIKVKEFSYPESILDEDGYPTEEALEYLRNWEISHKADDFYVGINWGKPEKEQELIDFIKSIWTYDDALLQTENRLELHTLGWSGNESIISYLRNTWIWTSKWFLTITGGHYYFKLSDDGDTEIIESLKS